jgi:hypothetical protein
MSTSTDSAVTTPGGTMPLVVLAWLWVAVPFGYGLYQLLIKIPALFSG